MAERNTNISIDHLMSLNVFFVFERNTNSSIND